MPKTTPERWRELIAFTIIAAKLALKRKKQIEHSQEQTIAQIATLEQQIYSIEAANINRETLQAMQKAGKAMEGIHGKLTIEKVDETMWVISVRRILSRGITDYLFCIQGKFKSTARTRRRNCVADDVHAHRAPNRRRRTRRRTRRIATGSHGRQDAQDWHCTCRRRGSQITCGCTWRKYNSLPLFSPLCTPSHLLEKHL